MDLVQEEFTLLSIDEELIFTQLFEYQGQMFFMFFQWRREDNDVVKEGISEMSIRPEYLIHHPIESGGGICQPKWHH